MRLMDRYIFSTLPRVGGRGGIAAAAIVFLTLNLGIILEVPNGYDASIR